MLEPVEMCRRAWPLALEIVAFVVQREGGAC
jgi:hypothetical protein